MLFFFCQTETTIRSFQQIDSSEQNIPLYCRVGLSNHLSPWIPASKTVDICFALSWPTVSIVNSCYKKLFHLWRLVFLRLWQGAKGQDGLWTPDSQVPTTGLKGYPLGQVANCWSNSRLQVFGTSALASFWAGDKFWPTVSFCLVFEAIQKHHKSKSATVVQW